MRRTVLSKPKPHRLYANVKAAALALALACAACEGSSKPSVADGSTSDSPDAAESADHPASEADALNETASFQADPRGIDFGTWAIGSSSAVQGVVVTNGGVAAVGPFSLSISGLHKGDFVISAIGCVIPLQRGKSCDVSALFRPTAAGLRQATIELEDASGNRAEIALTGQAVGPSELTWTNGADTNFGNTIVGQPATVRSFTVSNNGGSSTGMLSVTSDGASPSDFAIVGNACVAALAPGETCTIKVRFRPSRVGDLAARLIVSASPGGSLQLNLFGFGAPAPKLTISPATYDFGSLTLDQRTEKKTFTLTASGSPEDVTTGAIVTTTLKSLVVSENQCAMASLRGNGGSCTFALEFLTSTPGETVTRVTATSPTGEASATIKGTVSASGGAGLVGYWPMDGAADDRSGNGNHGQIVKGTAVNSTRVDGTFGAGRKDRAIQLANAPFTKDPTWITIPSSASINELGKNDKFTLMAWVKPTSSNPLILAT